MDEVGFGCLGTLSVRGADLGRRAEFGQSRLHVGGVQPANPEKVFEMFDFRLCRGRIRGTGQHVRSVLRVAGGRSLGRT